MKATRHLFPFVVLAFLVCISLPLTFAQSADTAAFRSVNVPAFQFQLINGYGIEYWNTIGRNSYYRIGLDVSLDYRNKSGTLDNSSATTFSSPASMHSQQATGPYEEKGSGYDVIVSGVCVFPVFDYANTTLYVGIGPSVEISKSNSTSAQSQLGFDTTTTSLFSSSISQENKFVGLGPAGIFGMQSRITEHFSVTAEVTLSAIYRWEWNTYANSETNWYPSPAVTNHYQGTSNTKTTGWTISLSHIRLGVMLAL